MSKNYEKVKEKYEELRNELGGLRPSPKQVAAKMGSPVWTPKRVLREAMDLWGHTPSPGETVTEKHVDVLTTYWELLEQAEKGIPPSASAVATKLGQSEGDVIRLAAAVGLMLFPELEAPPTAAEAPKEPPKEAQISDYLRQKLVKKIPTPVVRNLQAPGAKGLTMKPIYVPTGVEIAWAVNPALNKGVGWTSVAEFREMGYVTASMDDVTRDEETARREGKICLRTFEPGPDGTVVLGAALLMVTTTENKSAYDRAIWERTKEDLSGVVEKTLTRNGIPDELVEKFQDRSRPRTMIDSDEVDPTTGRRFYLQPDV